jgi:hypothetical protein
LRYQYRVTKYNPVRRDVAGAYGRDEWTSHSDIGRVFDEVALTEADYLRIESAYLFAVEAFLLEARISTLRLDGLERSDANLPTFVRSRAQLSVPQCVEFARYALREQVWGKLVAPARAYIHFGYDFYLYVGLPRRCARAVVATQKRGLFVEPFRSPYLRQMTER